jgi:branched-chain amino acid transport system permease protein
MSRASVLLFLVASVAAVAAPAWLDLPPYVVHILALSCLYAIPAIGLNLMLGYAGLVSLGHAGLAGVGAYALGVLAVDVRWPVWAALPVAFAAAAAIGAGVGAICLRLRSHYFMIVTLALGLILHAVMNNWEGLTRGPAGLAGIPRPEAFTLLGWRFAFGRLPDFAQLALAATALVLGVTALLVRSDFGRMLAAIRQDETLAAAKGVKVMACKVAVFAIGSGIAGLGGALKVSFLRVAAPASFDMLESINLVLIVIVGGAGRLVGPLLGAALFVALPESLRIAAEWRLVVFGAILVLLMRFAPDGLGGIVARLWRRRPAGTAA